MGKTDEQFREAAKKLHHKEGTLEIDDEAEVSRGDDDGAYVQAWVWVASSDTEPNFDGYHDCPCCGETHLDPDEELCDDCLKAGCEPTEDEDGESYQDCQIPQCPDCDVRASFCTDGKWHSNCDEGCANKGAAWEA